MLNLKGHSSGIKSVCISPDVKYILSGSLDQSAILYDYNSGMELVKITVEGMI